MIRHTHCENQVEQETGNNSAVLMENTLRLSDPEIGGKSVALLQFGQIVWFPS